MVHYEINEANTNEEIFINFMKELKIKLKQKNINNYVIILGNLSCHKTKSLKSYYLQNNINIVFNSPYNSPFNCIELMFRLIKRKLYQKLYSSTDEAIEEMKNIINGKKFEEELKLNYKETLKEYYRYSSEHQNINLNDIIY